MKVPRWADGAIALLALVCVFLAWTLFWHNG